MSKFAEKVKGFYLSGLWTRSMVLDALAKNRITQAEADEILNEEGG